jgi:hypothetical protein
MIVCEESYADIHHNARGRSFSIVDTSIVRDMRDMSQKMRHTIREANTTPSDLLTQWEYHEVAIVSSSCFIVSVISFLVPWF